MDKFDIGDQVPAHDSPEMRERYEQMKDETREERSFRMETELDDDVRSAMREARHRAEEESELDGYRKRAVESGTTVTQAMRTFTAFEDIARKSPRDGFLMLGQNLGVNPAQMIQMLAPYANTPDGGAALASQAYGLWNAQQLVEQARQRIPDFAALEGDIEKAFESGAINRTGNLDVDLRHAYEHVKHEREKAGTGKALAASRSLGGNDQRRHEPHDDSRPAPWHEPKEKRPYLSRQDKYERDLEDDVRSALQGWRV